MKKIVHGTTLLCLLAFSVFAQFAIKNSSNSTLMTINSVGKTAIMGLSGPEEVAILAADGTGKLQRVLGTTSATSLTVFVPDHRLLFKEKSYFTDSVGVETLTNVPEGATHALLRGHVLIRSVALEPSGTSDADLNAVGRFYLGLPMTEANLEQSQYMLLSVNASHHLRYQSENYPCPPSGLPVISRQYHDLFGNTIQQNAAETVTPLYPVAGTNTAQFMRSLQAVRKLNTADFRYSLWLEGFYVKLSSLIPNPN